MGAQEPGPLLASDESFNHQIVDTFARVGQSDRSWTEKVCAMACATDGSVQLAFGIGKYTNRGVMDAYAGISRGVEQWTVRASRRLSPDPERTTVGPISYEVVEPLRRIRFALAANDVLPIEFEWELDGITPPALEQREIHTSRDRYRIDADIIRYHQSGTARGTLTIDGTRVAFDSIDWVSTRDHSWGVRYAVGAPLADIERSDAPPGTSGYALWFPAAFTAPETPYAAHFYFQRFAFGDWSRTTFEGGLEAPDGTRRPFTSMALDLRYRDDNRRLVGGEIRTELGDGTNRVFTVEPVSDTGFHLGTGLYFGFDDKWHGQYHGKLHLEGEHIADCSDPATARRVHQHRDCVVRIVDSATGAVGFGNLQSIVTGAHPDLGLTDDASFT